MSRTIILLVLFQLIPALANAGNIENGKSIYMRKCKSCHRITEGVLVGPSLLGVTDRRSEEWIHKWIENPKAMLKDGDPIALELVKKYKKRMPKIKLMQDRENRDDVIAFLKSINNKQ